MPTQADQIKSLNQRLKAADRRIQKLLEENEKGKAKLQEALARADKAEKLAQEEKRKATARQAAHDLNCACITGVSLMVQRCLDLLETLPKDIPEADLDRINEAEAHYRQMLEAAQEADRIAPLVMRILSSGSERIGRHRSKSPQEIEKESRKASRLQGETQGKIDKKRRTIKTRQAGLGEALGDIGRAAQQAHAQEGDSASGPVKLADTVAGVRVPQSPEKKPLSNGKNTLGKQPLNMSPTREAAPIAPGPHCCPHCGSKNCIELASYATPMRNFLMSFSELVELIEQENRVMECEDCHECFLVTPESEPVPVTPLGTVSQNMAIIAAHTNFQGIPERRVQTMTHTDKVKMGHSTLGQAILRWMQEYGALLLRRMERRCKCAPAIAVDETPFTVLQQTGQSKVVRADKPKQGYVLVVSSVPHARLPFALYYQLDGRSGKYIRQRLEGFTPEVLVTDGYGEYFSDAMAETLGFKPGETFHQTCMVHFRRVVMDAVCPFFTGPVLKAKDFEEIKKKLDEASPEYILAVVLEALSKIYAHEQALKPHQGEDYEVFLGRVARSRRENAAVLMDCIDKLMESIREKLVVWDTVRQQYEAIDQNNCSAKAVRYYFNRRDEMRLFLTNPLVPPDSNTAERCVRAVAVLEDVCKFKQSPEYLASLCQYFSLFATAELYGITEPVKWLVEFGRALYFHRMNRTATHLRNEGLLQGGKICAFAENSAEGFDFEPWLPWNYAAARGLSPVPVN